MTEPHALERWKPGSRRRNLVHIDTCLICEQPIYAQSHYGTDEDYISFLHGNAHYMCVRWLRLTKKLMLDLPEESSDTQ